MKREQLVCCVWGPTPAIFVCDRRRARARARHREDSKGPFFLPAPRSLMTEVRGQTFCILPGKGAMRHGVLMCFLTTRRCRRGVDDSFSLIQLSIIPIDQVSESSFEVQRTRWSRQVKTLEDTVLDTLYAFKGPPHPHQPPPFQWISSDHSE